MSLSIDYTLDGAGWARCIVKGDESECVITASYLSDALADLIRAAICVAAYFRRVEFSFQEEPGEYRWVINEKDINDISLGILCFSDYYDHAPNSEGTWVFSIQCPPRIFALAVLNAATKLFEDLGAENYTNAWVEYPFPERELATLKDLLAAQE